jgi:hypothetical protein
MSTIEALTEEVQTLHRRLDIQGDLLGTIRQHLLTQHNSHTQLQATVDMLQVTVKQQALFFCFVCLLVCLRVCLFVCS